MYSIIILQLILVHFCFQFEIHKHSDGYNIEECDKYYNSNWGIVYFPETSESESMDCHVFYGT